MQSKCKVKSGVAEPHVRVLTFLATISSLRPDITNRVFLGTLWQDISEFSYFCGTRSKPNSRGGGGGV